MRDLGPFARRLAGIAFSAGLTLALLEASLRAAPDMLGGNLANSMNSAFRDWPLGFNVRDPEVPMNFMLPRYETRAYWNGYWWWHRTDAWGFRNPSDLDRKSLALLGDSLIYGLGVEEEDTVAHFLRAEHGRAAYNMGQQGDCLFQEYVLARLFLPRFAPDSVVLFVFLNDFRELEANWPTELTAPSVIDRIDYDALRVRLERPPTEISWRDRLRGLRVCRLGRGIAHLLAAPFQVDKESPELTGAVLDEARFAPIARYYHFVLADLARRCRAQHSELSVVLLEVPDEILPHATLVQARAREMLEDVARENGLRFLGTRDVFGGCPECFLPRDGHLSREGHRRLAAMIANELPAAPDRGVSG
jgi:hypothetical protein